VVDEGKEQEEKKRWLTEEGSLGGMNSPSREIVPWYVTREPSS
jgi:hypothetical protein